MSETIRIEMTAEQRVRISKIVDMKKEDWEEYQRLCDSGLHSWKLDAAINEIAERYDLNTEEPYDWEDLEDTTFEPFAEDRPEQSE